MKVFVIFLVLIGFAVIFSANIYAMPPFHSQEIYDFSNVIAMGKVISVNSTFSPTHNLYEIKVEKFLKNQQDSDVLFASGQKTANIRLGNQVFDVNDRGLFYLTNNTMGYDPYSKIFLLYPTSQLIEPEWDKCNIFDKEIPREHWVFGGTGQMPAIHQGNNTDIENFAIGKEVLVNYDIFNHSLDTKKVTYGIMIKKIDEPDYLYTETNNSYMLEPCVPYKTLTWTFTPTKSGQYAVEIYDLVGSQMGVWFTATLPLCTSDRTACFQDEYICDSIGWECTDTENIFNTLIDSPLKQFKSGIPYDEIKCKDNLVLIQKHDGTPACVTPDTISKLSERDWFHPCPNGRFNEQRSLCVVGSPGIGSDSTELSNTQFEEIKNDIESTGYDICDIRIENDKIIIDLHKFFEDSEPEKKIISKIPPYVEYEIIYHEGYSDYFISTTTSHKCE